MSVVTLLASVAVVAVSLATDQIKPFRQGENALDRNDFDKAIVYFTEAIRRLPHAARAYGHRALAYGHKGQSEAAIADCDAAIGIDAGYAAAYCIRGTVRMRRATMLSGIPNEGELSHLEEGTGSGASVSESGRQELQRALADFHMAIS